MKNYLRRKFINMIYDTPFESFARKFYMFFFQPDNYKTDKQTLAVMRKILTPESNCIDIGCYRGEILRHMIRLSPRGAIFGFEPTPYHHDFLKKRFPQAQIFQMALGQEKGFAKFYFNPEYPARSGLAAEEEGDHNKTLEAIEVRVDKLDNIIPGQLMVDFIKIDVEGAEYEVISGAKEMISRSHPLIIFEHSAEGNKVETNASERLYSLLCDNLGLRLFSLDQWLQHQLPMDKEAFIDCVKKGRYLNFIAATTLAFF
jgi:FkbM family methyltransferase